jgi:hypothetical protein
MQNYSNMLYEYTFLYGNYSVAGSSNTQLIVGVSGDAQAQSSPSAKGHPVLGFFRFIIDTFGNIRVFAHGHYPGSYFESGLYYNGSGKNLVFVFTNQYGSIPSSCHIFDNGTRFAQNIPHRVQVLYDEEQSQYSVFIDGYSEGCSNIPYDPQPMFMNRGKFLTKYTTGIYYCAVIEHCEEPWPDYEFGGFTITSDVTAATPGRSGVSNYVVTGLYSGFLDHMNYDNLTFYGVQTATVAEDSSMYANLKRDMDAYSGMSALLRYVIGILIFLAFLMFYMRFSSGFLEEFLAIHVLVLTGFALVLAKFGLMPYWVIVMAVLSTIVLYGASHLIGKGAEE